MGENGTIEIDGLTFRDVKDGNMSIEGRKHHFLAVIDRLGENAHDDRASDRHEVRRFSCANEEVFTWVDTTVMADPAICQVWVYPLESTTRLAINAREVRERVAAASAEVEAKERAELARLTAKYGATA